MKNVKLGFGVLTFVLGVTAISAGDALAYRGDPSVQGPNYSLERHEAMTKAFENVNYSEWSNLMKDKGRVTQIINENNFSKFVEAHKLSLDGKIDEAREIRKELGLGLQDGSGRNNQSGMNRGNGRGFGKNSNR